MATIEEIEDLSVEIINGVDNEEGEPKELKESDSSPVRTEDADAAALVLTTTSQEVQDSDEEDDEVIVMNYCSISSFFYQKSNICTLMKDFDETILERIVALSEMFPVCVQVSLSYL